MQANKTLHFVSGLPRACSTLLCNLLAQNPRVHATATSPLQNLAHGARQAFQSEEAVAIGRDVLEKMYFDYVRAGSIHAYDSVTDRPVVADKSRSWIGYLDQVFKIWPEAKILVPVRDMRGVLSSMERIYRKHPAPFSPKEKVSSLAWTTTAKRVQGWLTSLPVGIAVDRLTEAAGRFKDRLFFVHAEALTAQPKETMEKVWKYLGEEPFDHDFDNVPQYTHEVEVGWPYGDHQIRSKIEPVRQDWEEVFGRPLSEALKNQFDWVNKL